MKTRRRNEETSVVPHPGPGPRKSAGGGYSLSVPSESGGVDVSGRSKSKHKTKRIFGRYWHTRWVGVFQVRRDKNGERSTPTRSTLGREQ